MDEEEIDLINDEPFGVDAEERGSFLIRFKGEEHPFAVIVADNSEHLFLFVDEFADPFQCEYSALISGDGYRFETASASEQLAARIENTRAWRPIDCSEYLASLEKERLARLENEVADLQGIFHNLKRTANDRFGRHGRRSRKNAGALAQTGSGEN